MSFSQQSQKLLRRFNGLEVSNDNLHLIAISNLKNHERKLMRWWCQKYHQPLKPLMDHTMEELVIEYLEDYYEKNPSEIDRLMKAYDHAPEWDGMMSVEHEVGMQKILSRKRQIDLTNFKSDEELTPEEEEDIILGLGRNLPPRQVVLEKKDGVNVLGDEEFDEAFGE